MKLNELITIRKKAEKISEELRILEKKFLKINKEDEVIKKGKIYKISVEGLKNSPVYIGKTTQGLRRRLSKHRHDLKRYMNETYKYVSSYEVMIYEKKGYKLRIKPIKNNLYCSKDELKEIERYFVKKMKCCNINGKGKRKCKPKTLEDRKLFWSCISTLKKD